MVAIDNGGDRCHDSDSVIAAYGGCDDTIAVVMMMSWKEAVRYHGSY